jgi:membrane-bound lytic murein transglycosylase A
MIMPHSRCLLLVIAALALALPSSGCKNKRKPDFGAELPPGQMALRKIDPSEYPNFAVNDTDRANLSRAINYSLSYLAAPSSRQYYPYLDISHDRAVATLFALQDDLDHTGGSGPAFNEAIRTRYEVYKSIGAPDPEGGYTDIVLFTGYFTPIYPASLTRTGEFQYPLYRRPADLLSDPEGLTASRRTPDGRYVLYHTRDQIERGGVLAGTELVWLKSRWDAYVITVQGSAILQLTDGRRMEIGYAGNNGYPYTSPGRRMVADGVIDRDQLSLRGLKQYFEENPEAMDKYLSLNRRYVFFAERPGGPFGALNVPVTTMATIATDKQVYPRALAAFLTVPIPEGDTTTTADFRGWMLDQDAGGAIRASGRADIYMGIGEAAEARAGHQLHEGALYYVAVKPELIGTFAGRSMPQPPAVGPAPVSAGFRP